jgi:hypothetical protein
MSHTPGPWHVSDDAQGPMMVFADQHGKAVCSLTDTFSPSNGFIGDDEGVGRPTRTANARLIAAAPDLLAALECAEARLQALSRMFLSTNFTDRNRDGPACQRVADLARAAIKKAKGQ